jgi:hypothetical protein
MWKAISLNLIVPTAYFILYLLPRNSGFVDQHKLFIAEYGQGLIIGQFITCIIGCWICRIRVLQILLVLLLIFFGMILFMTIEKFNPF